MKSMQRFNRRHLILISSLAFLLMLVTTVAVVPSLRAAFKSFVFSNQREILAKTSAKISPDGPLVAVFKLLEDGRLKIEVYKVENSGETTLSQIFELNETRDGYIHLQGNATNLALSDTDNDGALDIIAPSFDDQMTPRLNIFRFNSTLQNFEKVTAP